LNLIATEGLEETQIRDMNFKTKFSGQIFFKTFAAVSANVAGFQQHFQFLYLSVEEVMCLGYNTHCFKREEHINNNNNK